MIIIRFKNNNIYTFKFLVIKLEDAFTFEKDKMLIENTFMRKINYWIIVVNNPLS